MTTRQEVDQALESIVAHIRRGMPMHEAVSLLRGLLRRDPNNGRVHYNLGVALSDMGELQEAVIHLKRAFKHEPENHDALTALGTAYARSKRWKQAHDALAQALSLAPDDVYAKRSMGTVASATGDHALAVRMLREVRAAMPDDEVAHQALGFALMEAASVTLDDKEQGELEAQADEVLAGFLKKHPKSSAVESAETARSFLAQRAMRRRVGGGLRPDVVMYIVGALRKFNDRGPEFTRAVTMEIAVLGQSGLNINDPGTTYKLETLDGEFTGLHLASMMYAGLKEIDPEIDSGIDFSAEYQAALPLVGRAR